MAVDRVASERSSASGRDRRFGLRLGLAGLSAFLLAVPFTFLLVLVLSESEDLEELDKGIADTLHDLTAGHAGLVDALLAISTATQPWLLRGVTLVLAVVLWRRGRRRVAVWLAVTMAIGGIVAALLKILVERARPEFPEPVTVASGYSFPSGHALNSMLLAACLLVLVHPATRGVKRVIAWILAVAFVALVAYDRIALGVHYVSDVVAGWVVALATVAATVAAFALWRRQEGLPPMKSSQGLDPEDPQPDP